MKMVTAILPLSCMIWLSSQVAHAGPADPFAAVEVIALKVADNVYMLEGRGGNIGVSVGADGTLIVDNQFAPLAPKIRTAIEKIGGHAPRIVLNTHYHADHTGGNPVFGKDGTIIAHHNVRLRLTNAEDFPRAGLPLVTYEENVSIHFNDDTLAVMHLPRGHTDGDSVVWFKSANVIHMGDHFFNGRFPYVDIDGGGSVDGFISNVQHVLHTVPDDIKIIPGHGALATKNDLKKTIEDVKASVQMIRRALAVGKEAGEIAETLGQAFPGMGSGFINEARWVAIVASDS